MSEVPIEELLKRCPSKYKLVILAVKRAKELANGTAPLVEMEYKKVTSIALEEVRQGKVMYKAPASEAGAGAKKPKGRVTKTKAKKRAET